MQRPRSRLPASALRSDGSFTLAPALSQTVAPAHALHLETTDDGGFTLAPSQTLAPAHALHLEATDKAGKASSLDTSAPPSFDLGPASDGGKKGDHASTVILVKGSTDPNAQVAPLGAERTASGDEAAWKATGADQSSVGATDSSGSYTSNNGAPVVAGTSSALEIVPSFQQALNADGVIGLAVMSGGTVEVSSAYSGPATFTGSSGILQLDQSASFSGTVSGMTGQDTLDLRDISFATIQSPTYSGTSTGGTLSVSDGTHNAKIALLGNYLASSFVASSDGHGGTNVVDPLATSFHGGLDVTQYGVVGDGKTDDTQALQSLISLSPNGTLFYFPAGTYLVSNTIHFSQGDFAIVGDLNPDGSPASILKSNTPNVTVADANYGTGVGSFQIRNMEFWASDQGGIGFYSQDATGSTIENSAFKGYIGLYNYFPFQVALRNDKFLGDGGNNGSHIGYLAYLSTESLIENSDFSGWDEGVRVSGAGMSMIGSTFERNGIGLNGGIDKDGNAWILSASTMTDLTFSDNDIGIKLASAADDSLSNSQITGSTNAPSGQSSIGLYANYIQQSQVTGLQVSGSYSNSAVQIDSGAKNDSFHANTVTNSNPTGKAWNIAANLPNVVVDSALLPGQAAITDSTAPSWYPSPGANIVDVTAHGVVGDNLTDDAAALQALVNSSPNGSIFYFPKGVYRLYSTVDFSRLTNFAIIGDDKPVGGRVDGSSIIGYFSSGPLITANYASTGGTFHIRDVYLRSNGGTAFASQNAVSSSIENVDVIGNIGIRLDNPVQVSLRSVNFDPYVDIRSVSLVGNNNLALVINGGHDNWLEQISASGYQEAIRATGDNLHVFSSRFEVNHIGLNLGVAPDGSIAPLTNSTFAGITEEANDTGFNLANCQNCYFESISGQGSSNAPTGMSITGIAIGDLSKNVTFAATDFEGDFTQQTLLVAPNADTIRFADTAFGNTSGPSTVIQNTTTTFSNSGVTPVDTFDHWINSAGGDWATAANWANGVPTANLAADIDASGTYTVTISSADTTYGLLINAAAAAVSDNTGGSLSITGSGGPSNPNGALTISAGSFALAGGGLRAGSISIANGGTLLVSQSYTGTRALAESITNNGSITISNSGIATFNGAISGAGSFTLQDRGSLEFGAANSENVTFAAGASGTLKIDHSLTASFTGYLSGLTTMNSVDLLDLAWTRRSKLMTATYSGTASGGTLTVSNGKNSVKLNLLGDYTTASWLLSKDRNGGTLVVDPPTSGSLTPHADHGTANGIDLSEIRFGANTTLAYAPNNDNTGGTLTVSDGVHAQRLALLGQYMASSFSMASNGHGGTLITDPALTQQSQLTLLHA